jgi:hypothetical protein
MENRNSNDEIRRLKMKWSAIRVVCDFRFDFDYEDENEEDWKGLAGAIWNCDGAGPKHSMVLDNQ